MNVVDAPVAEQTNRRFESARPRGAMRALIPDAQMNWP